MNIKEILNENLVDDRNLLDLSKQIISFILKNYLGKSGYLCSIGDIIGESIYGNKFDDTMLRIKNNFDNENMIAEFRYDGYRVYKPKSKEDFETTFKSMEFTIYLSAKYFFNEEKDFLVSALSHELRHLLDHIKSRGRITYKKQYNQKPKKPARAKSNQEIEDEMQKAILADLEKFDNTDYRTRDLSKYDSFSLDKSSEYAAYQSTKLEIHGRFQQAVALIDKFKTNNNISKLNSSQLLKLANRVLELTDIKRYFPKGTNNKIYKRLVSRLVNYASA